MRFRERDQASFRSYQRISLGKRQKLVQLVNEEGLSLSKVSKKLKLKLTTARLILKKYNQTGEFPMRKFKKKVEKVEREPQNAQVKVEAIEEALTIREVTNLQSVQPKKEQEPANSYCLTNEIPVVTFLNPVWPQLILWSL